MLEVNERIELDKHITREPDDDNPAVCRCERPFDPREGVCFEINARRYAYCERCLPEVYLESSDFIHAHLSGKVVSGSYLGWAMRVHNAISEMI